MSKTLFISKHPSELSALHSFAEANNMTVIAHSFLRFAPVPFSLPSAFDILFFGSPRAVMFFKAQYEIPSGKDIACVGGKTETLLRSLGHHVAFSGNQKGSIHDVASTFGAWAGDRRVLFPVSSRTLGTIVQTIPENRRETVVCYDTQIVASNIEPCDLYVFTSPSNVEGFFQENKLPEDAVIIAWGKSTEKALKAHHVRVSHTLSEPSIAALISTLKDVY